MRVTRRAFLATWLTGLVLFAIVILISLPLVLTAVPGGILDHQAAGSAAEANRIQQAWQAAGLRGTALFAMIGDLVFIGVYGVGSVMGGLWLRRQAQPARTAGTLVLVAGAVFLATDYAETLSQLVQLARGHGSDTLAAVAAMARPIKVGAWTLSFAGVLLGLLLVRLQRSRA